MHPPAAGPGGGVPGDARPLGEDGKGWARCCRLRSGPASVAVAAVEVAGLRPPGHPFPRPRRGLDTHSAAFHTGCAGVPAGLLKIGRGVSLAPCSWRGSGVPRRPAPWGGVERAARWLREAAETKPPMRPARGALPRGTRCRRQFGSRVGPMATLADEEPLGAGCLGEPFVTAYELEGGRIFRGRRERGCQLQRGVVHWWSAPQREEPPRRRSPSTSAVVRSLRGDQTACADALRKAREFRLQHALDIQRNAGCCRVALTDQLRRGIVGSVE